MILCAHEGGGPHSPSTGNPEKEKEPQSPNVYDVCFIFEEKFAYFNVYFIFGSNVPNTDDLVDSIPYQTAAGECRKQRESCGEWGRTRDVR